MTALAPTLEAFFTERLIAQRQASAHTVAAYRDTFRLLLALRRRPHRQAAVQAGPRRPRRPADRRLPRPPGARRGNSVRTRNARLAAIHSLFRYAALRHPEHAALIARVLAIPAKRADTAIVTFLTEDEVDALLAAPDRSTRTGRRDHAMLHLAVQTGLRVSELTALHLRDVHLGAGPHVSCHGKGRKQRVTPLTSHTVTVSRHGSPNATPARHDPLFPTRRGSRLSRDAVDAIARHAATPPDAPPRRQERSPRTSCATPRAMRLLHAGVDITVIALWLGHESVTTTQIYLHADMELKQRALDRTTPPGSRPGRYQPTDQLLAFLEAL